MKKLISDAEVQRLQLELRISNTPRAAKRGLQDLCRHYEEGRILSDSTDIRTFIHSHMHGDDVDVRRWSLKALSLISHPDDTFRIVERLRIEPDRKAQSWGVSGLVKQARNRGLEEVCKEAGLERDVPLMLASRLYAPAKWIEEQAKPVTISLKDDNLTLEWATFLIGYDKAPSHLFHPRFDNDVFLGELSSHDSPEISEYSVWALWERPDYNFGHLKIRPDNFAKRPENVRKWLYRLISQDPQSSNLIPDQVRDFRRDKSVPAREGLALGVTGGCGPEFDDTLIDWYVSESNPEIKAILLSGLTRRAGSNEAMAEIVLQRFRQALPGGIERRRILAAAEDTELYPELRRIEFEGEFEAQGLLEFLPQVSVTTNIGVLNMSKGNTINVGGNLQANNVVGGDMVDSANVAVQNMQSAAADKEVLLAVLSFLEKQAVSPSQKQDVSKAVLDVAEKPSKETKSRLLAALKALGEIGVVGGGFAAIVQLVTSWAS